MSQQRERRIVTEISDVPHIKGSRVDVLTVHDYVDGRGLDPEEVADKLNLRRADVHHALAYYYDHPEEIRRFENERERRDQEFKRLAEEHRPEGVEP